MKLGNATWNNAAADRLIKFGDGNYVSIGEAAADDRMQLTAKEFIFKRLSGTTNVGINTAGAPTAPLEVNGSIKMTDGNQGAGKVMTSGPTGVASWQPTSSAHSAFKSCGYSEIVCPNNISTSIPFFGSIGCSDDFDDAGGFDNANNRYVIQQTGVYHIDLEVALNYYLNPTAAIDGDILVSLEKNIPGTGSTIGALQVLVSLKAGDKIKRSVNISGTLKMSQGDYFGVVIIPKVGVTIYAESPSTKISGFRVY